ncbi:MAG: hypothetical protein ACK5LP_08010 [Campylobacteraceae bacterium]
MSELKKLIEKYNNAEDDDERANIIQADFGFLEDNAKWNFLLPLIEKENYDLIKVEIYKVIETSDFTKLDVVSIKDKIIKALKIETDELVKQFGFMSLMWNFNHFDDVLDFCLLTIEDENEDLDVRYNAFGVIEKSENLVKIISLKQRLLSIKEFNKYIKSFLLEKEIP